MNFEPSVKETKSRGYKIKDTLLNFIVPLISLGITLLLAFTIALPYRTKIPELEAKLTASQTLKGTLDTKLGVLTKLEDFEVVVQEDVNIFERALPEEAMVPELLTQVDTVARESGLNVTKLSYSISEVSSAVAKENQVATYEAIIINLGVEGGYEQIKTFLSNLENSARLVNVNTIRFSGESSEDTSKYLATFILSSPYLYVESQAVTDAEVTVDISNSEFLRVLEKAKDLKFYDINAETAFISVEESELSEVTAVEEDVIPEPTEIPPLPPAEESAPVDENPVEPPVTE